MVEPTPQPSPPPMTLEATAEQGWPRLWRFTITGAQGGVTVDFGDFNVLSMPAGDPLEFDHSYAAAGTYTVVASTGPQPDATLVVTVVAEPAIVTPEELVALLGLEADEAVRVAALVQIAITAYLWPDVVPEPVPPPIHAVGLALAARFSGAALTKAGAVTGETIGSYSYRLASPLTFDNVVLLLGDLAAALDPWSKRHQSTYTLDTSPGPTIPWPADWWQRDLDRLLTGDEVVVVG